MNQEDRDILHGVAKDVKTLLRESESQDVRITVLEHWRTGIVASCTSMFSALGMYFKMGGGNQ